MILPDTRFNGIKFDIFSLFVERSCLSVRLSLKRAIGHHLVQSYLPSILIVVISWVSFWLDVDAIPARVTLGVTTLLTISAESSDKQVSNDNPDSAHIFP